MSILARPYQPQPLHGPSGTALPVVTPGQRVLLRDPARTVFTDLHAGPCVFVHDDAGLDQALSLMLHAGVRMAFVRDRAACVLGLITAAALQGERPMQQVQQRGTPYHELTVTDVMTPVSRWQCMAVGDVDHARVGDIVATLRETGQHYLIVTECRPEGETICGLFSANRIERDTGEPIGGDPTRPRHMAEMVAETDVNL